MTVMQSMQKVFDSMRRRRTRSSYPSAYTAAGRTITFTLRDKSMIGGQDQMVYDWSAPYVNAHGATIG